MGKKRVLVVDDDADIRELLTSILSDQGAEVFAVSDGEALLRVIQARKAIDLVILDIRMRRMNGLEALRQLRQCGHLGCHTPVQMLSALPDERIERAARALGVTGFSRKPFKEEEIINVLKSNSLPELGPSELKSMIQTLQVQDPMILKELRDPEVRGEEYRAFPKRLETLNITVLVKRPFLVSQLSSLPLPQLAKALRIYRWYDDSAQLIWPSLRVQEFIDEMRKKTLAKRKSHPGDQAS